MENNRSTNQLFKGAIILTFVGLFSKILSAGYRIPLQNITGDLGFYIYQQIYPFLGIALMLSLYGFPSAISKLVSEQREEGNEPSLRSFYLPISVLLLSVNVILYIGLSENSYKIAVWMGDVNLANPIQLAAVPFLLIPFTSIIRGVFQGYENMAPTAISQVVEQLIRVAFIIFTAVAVMKHGQDYYQIGSGSALASVLGASAALVVLLFLWYKKVPKGNKRYSYSWLYYFRVVILYGVFISVNHMLLLLLQFTDAFTLVPNLANYGFNLDEAKLWKGVLDRGQPLIQLGTVLGSSLALALIPTVTKKRMDRHPDVFHSHIQSALKISLYISAGATIGLLFIFPYVNNLLFQDSLGNGSLRLLSCSILFTSLSITTATILQGLGYMYHTALYVFMGLACKWLLNSLLIPVYGLMGSALSTVISVVIVLVLNIISLKRILSINKLFQISWRTLLLAILSMSLFLWMVNLFVYEAVPIHSRIDQLLFVLGIIMLGAGIYLFVLIRQKGFEIEELQALPLGEWLVAIRRRN